MLPTIDFSLIGVVLAIWQVLKFVFTHLLTALEWVSHKMIAVLVSSKVWGTIFFVGFYLLLSVLLARLMTSLTSRIARIIISTIPNSNVQKSFDFISCLSPFRYVAEVFAFFASCFVNYRVAQQYVIWYCRIRHMYSELSRAWKL